MAHLGSIGVTRYSKPSSETSSKKKSSSSIRTEGGVTRTIIKTDTGTRVVYSEPEAQPEQQTETTYYVEDQEAQQTRPISQYEAEGIIEQQKQEREEQVANVIRSVNDPDRNAPVVADVQRVETSRYQQAEKSASSFLFPDGKKFDPAGISQRISQSERVPAPVKTFLGLQPQKEKVEIVYKNNTNIATNLRGKIIKQPIQTGVLFASSYGLGAVSSGVGATVKATSTTARVLRGGSAVLTGVYGGTQTYKFAAAPTFEEKEKVLSGTLYETTVFSAGARIGAAHGLVAGTKVNTIKFNRANTKWYNSLTSKSLWDTSARVGLSSRTSFYQTQLYPKQMPPPKPAKASLPKGISQGEAARINQQIFDIKHAAASKQFRIETGRELPKTFSQTTQSALKTTHYKPEPSFKPPRFKTEIQTNLNQFQQNYIEVSTPNSKPIKIKVDSSFWKAIGTKKYIPYSSGLGLEHNQLPFEFKGFQVGQTSFKTQTTTFSQTPTPTNQFQPFFLPTFPIKTSIDIKPDLKGSVKPSEETKIMIGLKNIQEIKPKEALKLEQFQQTRPDQDIGQILKPRQIQTPKQIPEQILRPTQTLTPIIKTPQIPINPPKPPTQLTPPTKPPQIPIIPPTITPPNFRRRFFKRFTTKLKPLKLRTPETAYKPTAYASSLKVFGKPTLKGVKTGLGVRPIPVSILKEEKKKKNARRRRF